MYHCCKKSRHVDPPKTVSVFVCAFFILNICIATGFLPTPFIFFKGGVLTSALTLTLIVFIGWKTALYELETMARAQVLCDLKCEMDIVIKTPDSKAKPAFRIKDSRKFEIAELCDMFVGKWFKYLYIIMIYIFNGFLALLTYAIIASSAWAVSIPFNSGSMRQCKETDFLHQYFPEDLACGNTYRLCLFILSCVVVPISLVDLKQQVVVQVIIGILRFLVVISILVYCLYYIIFGDPDSIILPYDRSINNTNTTLVVTSYFDAIFSFNFEGWIIGIPVMFYAITFHLGIPGLVHPIREKDRLKCFFTLIHLTIGGLYMVVNVAGAIWFRDYVNEIFTLNWVPYTTQGSSIPLRIFSYCLILFPSIDVCSVYPLVVHVVADNVYLGIFCKDISQERGWMPTLMQLVLRLVISLIPLVMAMFVTNLVYVNKYAGLIGFFVGMACPVVLQLRSQWVCREKLASVFAIGTTEMKDHADESGADENKNVADQNDDNDVGLQQSNPFLKKSSTENNCYLSIRKFSTFFLSFQDCVLYHTPYSTVLSYPLSVFFFSIVVVILFLFAVASLFLSV